MDDSLSELSEVIVSSPACSAAEPVPVHTPQQSRQRRRPQTQSQKLDKYLLLLRDDRWNLSDLVEALVVSKRKKEKSTFMRHLHQKKKVLDELINYNKDNVRDCLTGGPTQLTKEVELLASTSYFGTWKLDRVTSFSDLDMPAILDLVERRAPRLLSFLRELMRAPGSSRAEPVGRYIIVLAIICFSRHREKCNNLPTLLGLHLHSHGTKRRLIELLNHLGVSISYSSVNAAVKAISEMAKGDIARAGSAEDSITAYDNFEQTMGIKEQRIGDNSVFNSVTTGKVIQGRDIPHGGLRQDMVNPEAELSILDIVLAPGNSTSGIQAEISKFLIFESIATTFPDAICSVYTRHGVPRPQMPQVEVLPLSKQGRSVHSSLGPIPFDESSNAGNISVLQNIFRQQYRLGDDAFAERLFLIYGDQKTVQRLRTVKTRREDAISSYDSFKWLLPIPALFHLKMNYLKMIITAHYGTEDGVTDQSSLRHSKEFWNRRKVRPGGDSQEGIESQIRQQDPKSLHRLIDFLRLKFIDTPPHQCTDREFRNHILFLQHAETYLLLKYAIKHADIGLISHAVDRCCIYFHGSKQHKYAYEMLYFKRLTSTPAAAGPLRRAILANSLINLRGRPDSWFETDRLVELHNGKMKDILRTRHTSSITLDYLFEYCSLNSSFLTDLRRQVEQTFGVHVNSKHSTKSSQYDVTTLAAELRKCSMKFHPGRSTANEAPDLNTLGLNRLSEAIRRFNAQGCDTDLATTAEEETDPEDSIDNFYQFNEDAVSD
ncbi:MAG: hypothetical protein M1839_006119 [Geoglossum umbratile]|nr:MAG: hypothetical protein M1839_006119 [Geoglossum umbratile]